VTLAAQPGGFTIEELAALPLGRVDSCFRPRRSACRSAASRGGEQARVYVAALMLRPADLLVLDEPTNDLDIATLEVLEESLVEFPGAVLLVTHDRLLFERVTTSVLGLDGSGIVTPFADYDQWEAARRERAPLATCSFEVPSCVSYGRPEFCAQTHVEKHLICPARS
jgi:ABC-type sulfate/molybdate transport systems ATPase subunit